MNTASVHKPYTAILRDKRRAFPEWPSPGEGLAVFQGTYHCLIGLWILFGAQSFQNVVGPVKDIWLAQSVGILLSVLGVVFVMAALRSVLTLELGILMIGSSLGLGLVEAVYYAKSILFSFRAYEATEEVVVAILCIIFLKTFTHRRHSNFI